MQLILSVDTSSNPACAAVVEVEANSLKVVESQTFTLGALFSPQHFCQPNLIASSLNGSGKSGATEEAHPPHEAGSQLALLEQLKQDAYQIRNVLQSFQSTWSSSILIVPPWDYLSLNVDLPFAESKSIDRIIELEIQDQVPFDVQEFLLQHRAMDKRGDAGFDVHVSFYPRTYLNNILALCRYNEFEPLIVSTPMSVCGALFNLGSDYFAQDSAIIMAQEQQLYMLFRFDGKVVADRILKLGELTSHTHQEESDRKKLFTELKLTMAAFERRYGKNIQTVYCIGDSLRPHELQQTLARNVEVVSLSEFVKDANAESYLAGLGSIFARDETPAVPLTDFRIREFSYSPRVREIMRGLRVLRPYALVTLVLTFVYFLLSYAADMYYVNSVRSAIREQIVAMMPEKTLEPGTELASLQNATFDLKDALKSLGSESKLSPLDAFIELSQDIPVSSKVNVQHINISQGKVKVDMTADDYAAATSVENAFKQKRKVYCRIKKDSSTYTVAAGSQRGFTFELGLCD